VAKRELTDDEAESRCAARPVTELDLDDVVLERLAKSIVALSSAHALGLEYQGVAPAPEDVRDAVEWFRDNSRSFRELCLAAKLNSVFVRRSVLDRLGVAEAES
jgi:hypothetical protein